MDGRAAFEAWYVEHFTRQTGKQGFTLADLETMRGEHGDYRDYAYIHGAWAGFQAAQQADGARDAERWRKILANWVVLTGMESTSGLIPPMPGDRKAYERYVDVLPTAQQRKESQS